MPDKPKDQNDKAAKASEPQKPHEEGRAVDRAEKEEIRQEHAPLSGRLGQRSDQQKD